MQKYFKMFVKIELTDKIILSLEKVSKFICIFFLIEYVFHEIFEYSSINLDKLIWGTGNI